MRKLVTALVLVTLLLVGAFFLSETVFKADEPKIDGLALLQKDKNGNELVTVEIANLDGAAQVTISGPVLRGDSLTAELDAKALDTVQDALNALKIDDWTTLQEGQTVTAPAGGFALVLQYEDGTVQGTSSDNISPKVMEKLNGILSDIVADTLTRRLGIDPGWLGDLL